MYKSYINSRTSDFSLNKKLKKNKISQKELSSLFFENKILKNLIKEKLSLSEEQIKSLIEEQKDILIPISVFKNKLSTLEIIVKYLHETERLKFSEISEILSRDERTIWHAYRRSKKKSISLVISQSKLRIPVSIFSSRKYAPLEVLVAYLKDSHSLKNTEIADLLALSSKTIWTVYQRKKRKDEPK